MKGKERGPCSYLCGAFHWPALYLFAGATFDLVRSCSAGTQWCAANCRNDCQQHRYGDRALVHFHVCVCGEGDAGAIRSAAAACDSRTIPFCAKPDVHRCRARACRPGDLLPIDISRNLRRLVFARSAHLRGRVRRTDFAANLWTRIRCLLRPC